MVDKYEWLNFVHEEHVYNTLQIRDVCESPFIF